MSGAELCERQFQSTPPARGRLEKILLRLKKTAISIHAPREGGRLPSEYPGSGANDISIHAPARGGDRCGPGVPGGDGISIHAPARGGDRRRPCPSSSRLISIHAPARGGDLQAHVALVHTEISIHAPARGGDHGNFSNTCVLTYFNPRPREGGRQGHGIHHSTHHLISIHAPARGGDGVENSCPLCQ